MRRTVAATRCAAKTGSLIGVSALAGYCTTADGHTLAFAFLMNGISVYRARPIQDRMTIALAGATLGPVPAAP
jgi:D-alanyl-D-alanine carboxypeptidase/D-alanyl-D-alanine-endopeptidase (penicillin-binding protein 4)